MKMTSELEAMFTVPDKHTPKVLIGGGTDHKNFSKAWDNMVDPDVIKDMDSNSSRKGLPMHPVMVLLVQSDEDQHVHAIIHLPLQKWQSGMRVEPSVEDSKDLRRITDWCAGFLEMFCMNDSVTALDLTTNEIVLGDPDNGAFSIESIVKEVRPKKDVRGTGNLDIGSADEILGQMTQPQVEKMLRKSEQDEKKMPAESMNPAPTKRVPVKKIEDTDVKKQKEQKAIVDKYGWQALVDMTTKMKLPILIERDM